MALKLLLASGSPSRKTLLTTAKIPFEVIPQDADESEVDASLPFLERVAAIAQHKMNHVQLPKGKEGDELLVLTADTMGQDAHGVVHGKPNDCEDAVQKIKEMTDDYTTATAFCLHKKRFINGQWKTIDTVEKIVAAQHRFMIPDQWIQKYLDNSIGSNCAGGIAIEGYGEQFLDTVNGSYTTIKGLPMFELRQALEVMGFFN